jgi:ComF family protein
VSAPEYFDPVHGCQLIVTNQVDAWLKYAHARITAALWPPRCILCGGIGQGIDVDLCAPCEADLPFNAVHCGICSAPLATSALSTCGACLRRPPLFDASCIPFRFAYPIDHMVRRLKYGGVIAMGRVLGESFSRRTMLSGTAPELLLPVPLAQRRFRERGYNQAIVLAEHISMNARVALRTDLLVRTRETQVQAGLDQRARRRNIHDAFEVVAPLPATHVAILDDVVTTGSTVNELARMLKQAGVKRVDVWAIARA